MEYFGSKEGKETCIGIAMVYNYLSMLEKSIEFAEKALSYLDEFAKPNDFEDENKISVLYNILVSNYSKLDKKDEQVRYLEKILIKKYSSLSPDFSEKEIIEM